MCPLCAFGRGREACADGLAGSFLRLRNSSVIFTKRSGWLDVTPRHLTPFSIIARVPGGTGGGWGAGAAGKARAV